MIPALLGLIAPVAAVKVLSGFVRAAGAALRSAAAPVSLPSPSVVEKAAEVSEQVSDSPVIFAYDGMSRRTKITELSNGTVTSKKLYFWLGGSIVCERDGLVSGFPITKRYFGQGVLQGTTKLFYTTDHLGSVRELVDDAGTVQAQYRYSTYGERTKETGNLDSDWGYAGLWHHQPSGLDLATYRLYDAKNKRWISRDPLGEGVDYNLYRYVGNSPVNWIDPAGLSPTSDAVNGVGNILGGGLRMAGGALATQADGPVPGPADVFGGGVIVSGGAQVGRGFGLLLKAGLGAWAASQQGHTGPGPLNPEDFEKGGPGHDIDPTKQPKQQPPKPPVDCPPKDPNDPCKEFRDRLDTALKMRNPQLIRDARKALDECENKRKTDFGGHH